MEEHPRTEAPAIDVPEADALEMEDEGEEIQEPSIPMDVPEADALDQAREAGLEEEGYDR
jgi:hypothetical protein